MKVRVSVRGDRQLVEDLKRLGGLGRKVGRAIVRRVVLRAAGGAQSLAPVADVDGGQLRDSIRATNATVTRKGVISAAVVAGGAKAMAGVPGGLVYPIVQHEDTTLRHDDGQAKFVEVPAFREFPKLPGELRAELDQVMDRQGFR